MKKKYQNLFFLFGLAVLIVMVTQLDFKQVWQGISHAGYWFFAVVVLWFFLYMFNTAAWYIIIKNTGKIQNSKSKIQNYDYPSAKSPSNLGKSGSQSNLSNQKPPLGGGLVGIPDLLKLLNGKVTLLSGNSGVGKSTLINALIPDAHQKTAEISDAHDTGMHTTTFSEMLELSGGGYIIDTPGIKGFGTFDIERSELTSYFREIFKFSKDCRFSNCTHTNEPGCAVKKAVEEHYIAESRYNSYLSMLDDKDESKYREAF